MSFGLACHVILIANQFFELKVTNADGLCLNAIIPAVRNITCLGDALARLVPLIRIHIHLSKLAIRLS
jgi:hypothetical protein